MNGSNGHREGQLWKVVGGAEVGGLKVREDKTTSSMVMVNRLATGSLVQEILRDGTRLCYHLVEGTGPEQGWVSIKVQGKDLLVEAPDFEAQCTGGLNGSGGGSWQQPALAAAAKLEGSVVAAGDEGGDTASGGEAVALVRATDAAVAVVAAPGIVGGNGKPGTALDEGSALDGTACEAQTVEDGGAQGQQQADGGPADELRRPRSQEAEEGRQRWLPWAQLDVLREQLTRRSLELEHLEQRLSILVCSDVDWPELQAQLEQLAHWAREQALGGEVPDPVAEEASRAAIPGGATGASTTATSSLARGGADGMMPESDCHTALHGNGWAELEAVQTFAEALRVSWPGLDRMAETYSVDVWLASLPGWTVTGLVQPELLLQGLPESTPVQLRVAACGALDLSGERCLQGPWVEVETSCLDLSLPRVSIDPDGCLRGACARSGCRGYVSAEAQDPFVASRLAVLCARCGVTFRAHELLPSTVEDPQPTPVIKDEASQPGVCCTCREGALAELECSSTASATAEQREEQQPEGLAEQPASQPAEHREQLSLAHECWVWHRGYARLLCRAYLDVAYRSVSNHPPRPAPAVRTYRSVTVFRTRKGVSSERLQKVDFYILGQFRVVDASDESIFVSPDTAVSKPWMGFGGSFTEAAAVALSKMPPRQQEEVLRAYFSPDGNMRYTLGRVHIGSCDFCTGSWICGNLADGDRELRGFSIARYHDAILPMIQRAAKLASTQLVLLASPWTPPPWMKTNRTFSGGGRLRGDCLEAWALHYVRFVEAMAAAGCHIWGVSVQNEPEANQDWESCQFTAEQERDFVRDHLGPALEKAGLGSVKVLIWDHNRNGMVERAAIAYSDPQAAKYIWGVAYHWYGDARFESWPQSFKVGFQDRKKGATVSELRSQLCFENVRRTAELRPDKHVLQTESCQELDGRSLASMQGEWKLGERYAMNIIADMNSGCEGWIDWNLVLDGRGGPNHCGNFCVAPIICDAHSGEVRYEPAYWYIAHFARFIQPGARRVVCSSSLEVLEVTAFKNPGGNLVIVVLNQSTESLSSVCLKILGSGSAIVTAPAKSITTFVVTS